MLGPKPSLLILVNPLTCQGQNNQNVINIGTSLANKKHTLGGIHQSWFLPINKKTTLLCT
jgi:hypothetical protein